MRRPSSSRNDYYGRPDRPKGGDPTDEGKPSKRRRAKSVGTISLMMARKSVRSLKILILVVAGLFMLTAFLNFLVVWSTGAIGKAEHAIRLDVGSPEDAGAAAVGEEDGEEGFEESEDELEAEDDGYAAATGAAAESDGGELRTLVAAIVWGFIGAHAALALVFVGLFFAAGRYPLAAAVASLVIYLSVTAALAVLNPLTIANGLLIKIIIVTALMGGITAGIRYNNALRRLEMEKLREQERAAGEGAAPCESEGQT